MNTVSLVIKNFIDIVVCTCNHGRALNRERIFSSTEFRLQSRFFPCFFSSLAFFFPNPSRHKSRESLSTPRPCATPEWWATIKPPRPARIKCSERRRTLLPSMHTMGEYRDSNAVHRADGLRGLVTKTTGRSSPKGKAMRIYRRLPTIQSGIAAKRRKLWLIAASTLASAFLGVSEPALAQTFDSSGNDYPSGINASGTETQALSLTL